MNKNVKIIIITKPRISVQDIYHTRYFLQKGKFVLRSLLSEGSYFRGESLLSGFANTCNIFMALNFRNFTV